MPHLIYTGCHALTQTVDRHIVAWYNGPSGQGERYHDTVTAIGKGQGETVSENGNTPQASNSQPSEVDSIAEKLAAITKSMEAMQQQIEPLVAMKQAIAEKRSVMEAEYRKSIEELKVQDRELDSAMWDVKKSLRSVKVEADSLQRQFEQAQRLEKARTEFAALQAKWDTLTIRAPWREWAKDHQIEAARFITHRQRMILADTMGLGKTLSAIAALDMIQAATQDASPSNPYMTGVNDDQRVEYPAGKKVLYFCPATVMRNVEREVRRWAPHRSVVLLGGQPKIVRRMLLDVMKEHPEYVVICNYEAWRKDKSLIDDLIDIQFDTCIIDEAHNIKDRKSVAYRGISRILNEGNVPFVVPMTGTPILNKPQELFSLLTLVDPNHFYNEYYFLHDYCRQDPYTNKWEFRPGGLDLLAKRIGNYFLRRTKEQAGIMLPPKTINIHEIEVDEDRYAAQARARKEMRTWGSIMLDKDQNKAVTAAAAIAVYTRLRQIETWPAGIVAKNPLTGEVMFRVDIEESQKIDEVIRYENGENNEWTGLLPEVVTDERVVVFSQFKEPLKEIERRCNEAGIKVVRLDGDTPANVKERIVKDFDNTYQPDKAKAEWDVVLCNYKVGGVGLNFTAATQMIVLDEEWNPGKRDQAYDRIHRMGQDKPVTIHVLRDVLPLNGGKEQGGIDVWLARIIEHKEGVVGGFNESMDLASEGLNALKSGLI